YTTSIRRNLKYLSIISSLVSKIFGICKILKVNVGIVLNFPFMLFDIFLSQMLILSCMHSFSFYVCVCAGVLCVCWNVVCLCLWDVCVHVQGGHVVCVCVCVLCVCVCV
ncbi:mCG144798, partial [Mus musculus]